MATRIREFDFSPPLAPEQIWYDPAFDKFFIITLISGNFKGFYFMKYWEYMCEFLSSLIFNPFKVGRPQVTKRGADLETTSRQVPA